MKLSNKLKKTIKKRILHTTIGFALVLTTLAMLKLVDISASKKISKFASRNLLSASDETNVVSNTTTDDTITEDKTSDKSNLNGVKINEKEYTFEDGKTNYDITLPYDTGDILKLEFLKVNEGQTISGETQYIMSEENKIITFKVFSEDKTNSTLYTLNLSKVHNAYLKNIDLPGYNLNPDFSPETTDYAIQIFEGTTKANIFATPYDKNSVVTIEGQDNISIGSKITITVTNQYVTETMIYTITCEQAVAETNFSYSGNYQIFTVPYSGIFRLECWGGKGGQSRKQGSLSGTYGKGGYAKGEIALKKGEKYYVYVGENGNDAIVRKNAPATWNGGGLGTWDNSDDEASGSGGGATDIRLVSGDWNNEQSLASRIIVAGGAGGMSYSYTPGNGGGLEGTTSYSGSPAGTQTSGYKFGVGRDAWGVGDSDGVGGGGRRLLWRAN